MPSAGMRALVPPILGNPMPHGLLGGCIDVITTTDVHELNGTEIMAGACTPANAWQDCADVGTPDPITGPYVNPTTKTFDRSGNCGYEPITAYAGAECSTVGVSWEEMRARALATLELGEQRVLEEFVMTRVLAKYALGNDLTPVAGALSPVAAVAALETWLATNYGGEGLLHVPVGVAAYLSSNTLVDFASEEACPTTLAGNGIVIGAGYADSVGPYTAPLTPGTAAPDGEAWLYATPAMRIRRDDRHVVQSEPWQSVDTLVNDWRVLAETTFVPELACCTAAAVRVSLA